MDKLKPETKEEKRNREIDELLKSTDRWLLVADIYIFACVAFFVVLAIGMFIATIID